jgi:hypothetical protein
MDAMKETGARCNGMFRIGISLVLDRGAARKKPTVAAGPRRQQQLFWFRHSAVNLPEFGRIVN